MSTNTVPPKPEPTFDWDALDVVSVAKRPEGFTLREYAKKYGTTRDQAKGRVGRLIERGVVKVSGVWNVNGHVSVVYDIARDTKGGLT